MAEKKKTVARDSRSGQFTTPGQARKSPATTETERVRVGKRSK